MIRFQVSRSLGMEQSLYNVFSLNITNIRSASQAADGSGGKVLKTGNITFCKVQLKVCFRCIGSNEDQAVSSGALGRQS